MSNNLVTVFTPQGYMETAYDIMGLLILDDKEFVSEDPEKMWYVFHRWGVYDRQRFVEGTAAVAERVKNEYEDLYVEGLNGEDLFNKMVQEGYFITETDWTLKKAIARLLENGKYIPVFETETYKKLGKYSILFDSNIKIFKYIYYLFPFLLPIEERKILRVITKEFGRNKHKTTFQELKKHHQRADELQQLLFSLYQKRCIYIYKN